MPRVSKTRGKKPTIVKPSMLTLNLKVEFEDYDIEEIFDNIKEVKDLLSQFGKVIEVSLTGFPDKVSL